MHVLDPALYALSTESEQYIYNLFLDWARSYQIPFIKQGQRVLNFCSSKNTAGVRDKVLYNAGKVCQVLL